MSFARFFTSAKEILRERLTDVYERAAEFAAATALGLGRQQAPGASAGVPAPQDLGEMPDNIEPFEEEEEVLAAEPLRRMGFDAAAALPPNGQFADQHATLIDLSGGLGHYRVHAAPDLNAVPEIRPTVHDLYDAITETVRMVRTEGFHYSSIDNPEAVFTAEPTTRPPSIRIIARDMEDPQNPKVFTMQVPFGRLQSYDAFLVGIQRELDRRRFGSDVPDQEFLDIDTARFDLLIAAKHPQQHTVAKGQALIYPCMEHRTTKAIEHELAVVKHRRNKLRNKVASGAVECLGRALAAQAQVIKLRHARDVSRLDCRGRVISYLMDKAELHVSVRDRMVWYARTKTERIAAKATPMEWWLSYRCDSDGAKTHTWASLLAECTPESEGEVEPYTICGLPLGLFGAIIYNGEGDVSAEFAQAVADFGLAAMGLESVEVDGAHYHRLLPQHLAAPFQLGFPEDWPIFLQRCINRTQFDCRAAKPNQAHVLWCDTHIDILDGDCAPTQTNLWMDENGRCCTEFAIGQRRRFRKATRRELGGIAPKDAKDELMYVFFDYETVVDYRTSQCMKPYSVAYCTMSGADFDRAALGDGKDPVVGLDAAKVHVGFDCNEHFWADMERLQPGRKLIFVSFNGSFFDNFLLLHWLGRNRPGALREVLYTGNSILGARINGRHGLFDLRRHLNVGTLAFLTRGFNVATPKGNFDHHAAQCEYLANAETFIAAKKADAALAEYNKADVVSLAQLMIKYHLALMKIPEIRPNVVAYGGRASRLYQIPTSGGLIYKAWMRDIGKKGIKIPKFAPAQIRFYRDILKYKVAGRCNLYNGPVEIAMQCMSMDVCSMYPYVMAVVLNGWYPAGDILEVAAESEIGPDRIGWLYCDIDQTPLAARNAPYVYPEKVGVEGEAAIENNWDNPPVLMNYFISTVEIDILRRHGCIVTTRGGIVFTERVKGCDLFQVINGFMRGKNEQDALKAARDPAYNNGLRETFKLAMNSLSGKVIERLHTDKVTTCYSIAQYADCLAKYPDCGVINSVGDSITVQYKVPDEEVFSKHRPIFYGSLIYTYARGYLYDHVISKIPREDLIYTDTDSVKIRAPAARKWIEEYGAKTIVPAWPEAIAADPKLEAHPLIRMTPGDGVTTFDKYSKVFGAFEDEYAELDAAHGKTNNYSVHGGKKSYFVGHRDPETNAVDVFKGKLKGVGMRDLFVPPGIAIPANPVERYHFYNAGLNRSVIGDDGLMQTGSVGFGNNISHLFAEIRATGHATVLCSSMRKSVRNTHRGVGHGVEAKYNNNHATISLEIRQKRINRA